MPGAYLAVKDSPVITSEWQAWILICFAVVCLFVVVTVINQK